MPGVDFTAVGAFLAPDDAILLASRSAGRFPMRIGDHLPAHRASKLWGLARNGPWAPADVTLSRNRACACHHQRRCTAPVWCLGELSVDDVAAAVDRRVGGGTGVIAEARA